jgi:hypothetical protein
MDTKITRHHTFSVEYRRYLGEWDFKLNGVAGLTDDRFICRGLTTPSLGKLRAWLVSHLGHERGGALFDRVFAQLKADGHFEKKKETTKRG